MRLPAQIFLRSDDTRRIKVQCAHIFTSSLLIFFCKHLQYLEKSVVIETLYRRETLIPASLSGMYLSAAQACMLPLEYPTTQNLSLIPTASAKSNISIAEDSRFLLGWGSLSPKPGRSYDNKRTPNSSNREALSPGIPNFQKNDTNKTKKVHCALNKRGSEADKHLKYRTCKPGW